MTTNGEHRLNPSTLSSGDLDRAASPKARKAASPRSFREHYASSTHRPQNGDNPSEDGQNESEAETVVLDDAKDHSTGKKKVIKTERDDDDVAPLRSAKESSRPSSVAPNGHKTSSSEGKENRTNGIKHASEHETKSIPTSPSSRTASRHTKETSPADSAKSANHSVTSPAQNSSIRGRSASTMESRKRKLREESHPKALEPPRQKAKTEAPKDHHAHPTSPDTPGIGRPHKRSQSTQ